MSLHAHARGLLPRGVRPHAASATPADIPWARLGAVRIGIVLWGGLLLLDVGRVAAAPAYVELGAVAILVTAASLRTRTSTGLCAAVVGWLLVDGFVEHRDGVLGFDLSHDLAVLILLAGLALAATHTRR